MNDGKRTQRFNKHIRKTETDRDKFEQQKRDMGIDRQVQTQRDEQADSEYDELYPTLDMDGQDAEQVKRNIAEEKRYELWAKHRQQEPILEPEKTVSEHFEETSRIDYDADQDVYFEELQEIFAQRRADIENSPDYSDTERQQALSDLTHEYETAQQDYSQQYEQSQELEHDQDTER